MLGDGTSGNLSSQTLEPVADSLTVLLKTPHPPVLAPIESRSCFVGDSLVIRLSATDPDADSLRYAAGPLPTAAALVDSTFRWLPQPGQGGSYSVVFTVDDGNSGLDSQAVAIAVIDTSGYQDVRPTSQWLTVFGEVLTAGGQPAPAGTVVDVVDSLGVLCGWCQVDSPGAYGYLPVYLDDPLTEQIEGARVGGLLSFRVNRVLTPYSMRWSQFGDVVRMDIAAHPRQQVTLSLAKGYNLVSCRLRAVNDSISAIVAPIVGDLVQVQGFESEALNPSGGARGAKLFTPTGGGFNTLHRADFRLGYWVKMRAPRVLTVTGWDAGADSASIPLTKGFNLVAYLPVAADSTGHAFASLDSNLVQVQGFETAVTTRNRPQTGAKIYLPHAGVFSTLRIASPALAYWVKAAAADTLVYPSSPVPGVPAARSEGGVVLEEPAVQPTEQWIALYGSLRDWQGRPAAVGTRVEAVDGDGAVAGAGTVESPGLYGYLPVYLDDPATPEDEGAVVDEWLTLRVDGVPTGTRVRWTAFGDVVACDLVVPEDRGAVGDPVPTRYALYVPRPNPFNPTTTIRYDLAESGPVRLSLFTATGQVLRQLVSASQAAGAHNVVWDGRDDAGAEVSSGVYLARLEAGDFRAVTRMVLMK